MEVIIQPDYQQMSKVAAQIVAEVLNTKPNAVLGMATGSMPLQGDRGAVCRWRSISIAYSFRHGASLPVSPVPCCDASQRETRGVPPRSAG